MTKYPFCWGRMSLVTSKHKSRSRIQDGGAVLTMFARQETLVNITKSLGSLTILKPLTIPPNGRTRIKAICQRMTFLGDGSTRLLKRVLATPSVNTSQPGRKRTKLPVELVYYSAQIVTGGAKAHV